MFFKNKIIESDAIGNKMVVITFPKEIWWVMYLARSQGSNYTFPLGARLLSGPNYYFPDTEQCSWIKYMQVLNWIFRLTEWNPFIFCLFFQNSFIPSDCQALQNQLRMTFHTHMMNYNQNATLIYRTLWLIQVQ